MGLGTRETADGGVVISLDRATRMLIAKAYIQGVTDCTNRNQAKTTDEAVERVWASISDLHDSATCKPALQVAMKG